MISFSYKPAPKLVAMGNAYCRTWIFGACQNFLRYHNCLWCQPRPSAVVPVTSLTFATARYRTVWKSPARRTELCWWKMGRRRESRTSAFEVRRVVLSRYISPKLGAREMRQSTVWVSGKCAVWHCAILSVWIHHACLQGPGLFVQEQGSGTQWLQCCSDKPW